MTTPYPIKTSFKYFSEYTGSISYVPCSYPMVFTILLPPNLLACSNCPWPGILLSLMPKFTAMSLLHSKGSLMLITDSGTASSSGVYPYLHQVCHCPLWRVLISTIGALAPAAAETTGMVFCLCRSPWHHDCWHRAFSQEIGMKTALLAFTQCHCSLSG